ncbi:hypothetical protein HDU96_007211 [Phlyctochytrium bullatum]|nr:hypothetical protein HDU96_007211 [Phlyctochytrium bullatum]
MSNRNLYPSGVATNTGQSTATPTVVKDSDKYDAFRFIFKIILHVFFREITVRGSENIPKEGPTIFVIAPHANQFVDPMTLITKCHRRISFLIAKASYDRKLVGAVAKSLQTIPVTRPQDVSFKGSGALYLPLPATDPTLLHGLDTRFLAELQPRTVISIQVPNPDPRPNGPAFTSFNLPEVAAVISDTEVRLARPVDDELVLATLVGVEGCRYKVTPYVDQSTMFESVAGVLEAGGAVGIFPEGGSHDRPHLLPLKAGVAIMALSAMAKNTNLNVKIVPVGLNYFHPDRFRSRAVVEFGPPIEIKRSLVQMYESGGASKKEAVASLIQDVKAALSFVTVEYSDFQTMMVITAARRLYNHNGVRLTSIQNCELSRRFTRGYLKFKDEPDVQEVSKRLLDYNTKLRAYGLHDYQVASSSTGTVLQTLLEMVYRIGVLVLFSLLALPGFVLNFPVMSLCEFISKRKARDALANSSVKLRGSDVIATWKILVAVIAFPLMHITFAVLIFFLLPVLHYVGGTTPSILLRISASLAVLVLGPLLSYVGIRAMEVGMDYAKSLKPLALILLKPRSELAALVNYRLELQLQVNALVATYNPRLDEHHVAKTAPVPEPTPVVTEAVLPTTRAAETKENNEKTEGAGETRERRASVPAATPVNADHTPSAASELLWETSAWLAASSSSLPHDPGYDSEDEEDADANHDAGVKQEEGSGSLVWLEKAYLVGKEKVVRSMSSLRIA